MFLKVFFIFIALSMSALAAQDAWVSKQSAPVLREPREGSELMKIRTQGEHLRISSTSREGWFKTKNSDGTFGWIHYSNLSIGEYTKELAATGIDMNTIVGTRVPRTRDYVFIRPQVMMLSMYSTQLGGFHYSYPLSAGLSVDGSYAFEKDTRAVLRLGYYKSGVGSSETFNLTRSGIPVLGGIEYAIRKANRWHHCVTLLGGADFANYSLTSSSGKFEASGLSVATPMLWFAYTIKSVSSKHLNLTLDIGGFFGLSKNTRISNAPFLSDAGSPDTLRTRFSGLALAFGAEWGTVTR